MKPYITLSEREADFISKTICEGTVRHLNRRGNLERLIETWKFCNPDKTEVPSNITMLKDLMEGAKLYFSPAVVNKTKPTIKDYREICLDEDNLKLIEIFYHRIERNIGRIKNNKKGSSGICVLGC